VIYAMREPCSECPFLRGSPLNNYIKYERLLEFAEGEFPCHRACKVDENEGFVPRNDKTPHCAGALIFNERRGRPHQMMRICERIGHYDRTKLNMHADVGSNRRNYQRARVTHKEEP